MLNDIQPNDDRTNKRVRTSQCFEQYYEIQKRSRDVMVKAKQIIGFMKNYHAKFQWGLYFENMSIVQKNSK